MKFDWIKKRQTKYAAYATTYIAVVVAVLGAANFLANRYNKSYDSTSNKQFSLSDQTIKVVRNLKKDVKITYFDESSRFPQARDLLGRYATLSPKVQVDYVDPVRKPQIAKAAGFRRDAPILVDSGVRKEEAKSLTEEEITGALIRSLKTGERNVCFVSGSGEHGIDDSGRNGYSALEGSAGAQQLQDAHHFAAGRGARGAAGASEARRGTGCAGAGRGQARSAQGLLRAGGGRPALRLHAAGGGRHQGLRRKRRARAVHARSAPQHGPRRDQPQPGTGQAAGRLGRDGRTTTWRSTPAASARSSSLAPRSRW